ncbi:uncharacterized protein B0H64DRAFT_87966 [Chaetomium fimeti]|uniref:Uncharacterized protein n=1 Tax=Chaetomium fimeti TaxID=1854472 RepID=A0AAE0HM85_9PEZI|nr:hypothetical protein B0H64DRAFT_87966 [Chaetomium fimeti]
MPGLTITTDVSPSPATAEAATQTPLRRRPSASSRPASPSRPSVSPITPTHESAEFPAAHSTHPAPTAIPDFASGRPMFTHANQVDQVGVAPPPAQPIDFESNPDVLALKSAISILQIQRARAAADIQSLGRARDAALANPEAFTADLASGSVRMEGDPLLSGTRGSSGGVLAEEDDSDSDSDSESGAGSSTRQEVTPESETKTDNNNNNNNNRTAPTNGTEAAAAAAAAPAWQKLPKPQTVVRCPPVNWAQYGVVGESLDKLHAEQVAAPTPGAPKVLGQGGAYEFKAGAGVGAGAGNNQGTSSGSGGGGGGGGGGEPSRRLVGVAAPYSPMRDKLEKKGRGGKR